MDNFSNQRYDTKIETFETCMIDSAQQPEMTQTVERQVTAMQSSQIDGQNNNATTVATATGAAMNQQTQQQQSPHSNQMMQLHGGGQQNMTLTPVRLPAILDGEFFTVIRVEDTNVTVRCLQCQKLLNGNLKSTGNFLSHIKRVHPFMVDRIKCKSNQRRPAMIYIDVTSDNCPEIVKSKHGYRKYYKVANEDCQPQSEENFEQSLEWPESPATRKRKLDEPEINESHRMSYGNSSIIVEDEFDAIGRNVAAKLRNMRLDQRIIAEKLLNDILFEAQLGNLHRDSNIHV